jgi:hypothetical protein
MGTVTGICYIQPLIELVLWHWRQVNSGSRSSNVLKKK